MIVKVPFQSLATALFDFQREHLVAKLNSITEIKAEFVLNDNDRLLGTLVLVLPDDYDNTDLISIGMLIQMYINEKK